MFGKNKQAVQEKDYLILPVCLSTIGIQ